MSGPAWLIRTRGTMEFYPRRFEAFRTALRLDLTRSRCSPRHSTSEGPRLVRPTTGEPYSSWKKSFPLSSTRMNAGKSFTSIFQTASMPSSGYSRTSTLVMLSWARTAAGPPMDPR